MKAATVVARRLTSSFIVVTAAVSLLFAAMAATPGDPVSALTGRPVSAEYFSASGWGAASFVQRLGVLSSAVANGGFTHSIHYDGASVLDIVLESLPPTLLLCGGAMLSGGVGAVALALWAAAAGRAVSNAVTLVFTFCLSLPVTVAAAGLVWGLSASWRLLPAAGWDDWRSAVSPTVALAIPLFGHIGRTAWALAAEAATLPYVQAARAKGLSRMRTAARHVFPNIAGPLAASCAAAFAAMLGGAALVETLFAVPGIGREVVRAALNRDYPVMLGGMLAFAALNALAGAAADVVAAAVDPRGRSTEAET